MEIVQCEYYREQLSNHLYKAIGNQPLPDEYRDKESEELYKNYYYFLWLIQKKLI